MSAMVQVYIMIITFLTLGILNLIETSISAHVVSFNLYIEPIADYC